MIVEKCALAEQKEILQKPFPIVYRVNAHEGFWEWVESHKEWFREQLCTYGALLLRDAPIHKPKDFEELIDRAGFPRMPYVGGAAPRSAVTSRVLTSNESPPSEPIPFHHEMAQVPKPPAYIFFYCDLPSQEGGETAIAHSVHSYEQFVAIDPQFAKKVESQGVRYIRVMPKEDDPSSAIGRSWQSTFQVSTKEDAEEKMREAGMTWTWLDNGDLRTETATLPAIREDARISKKTFFNSIVAAYTGWTDTRNDPKKAVVCGDGSYMDPNVLQRMAQSMEQDSVGIAWKKGDVLMIDNRLVLHSRRPFSGERRILATIAPY